MATTFRTTIELRFTDCDVLGHVNNTKFLEFAQDARIRFFEESGVELDANNSFVVRHLEVDFERPLFLDSGPILVELSVLRIGGSSFSLRHDIFDKSGSLTARVDAVIVGFDPTTNTSKQLSPQTRSLCEKYLVAD